MKQKGKQPLNKAVPLWEILVPYNMGRKTVQVPYHQEWDTKVMDIAGGLTILRAVKGAWVESPEKTVRELMIPVRIACTEEQMQAIAKMTLEHYEQDAVFVHRVSEASMVLTAQDFAPELFVVRLYDGMDRLWMDVSKPVSREEADRIWNEKTHNGTKNTCFGDIDYYAVYPADTKMMYGSENYEELLEAGLIRP
ncbi:MAG: hypothetical protein JSS66_07970 [Armatimonadetes bacterium]|nr:hypothetical protein [Armatimonadota bacterium]